MINLDLLINNKVITIRQLENNKFYFDVSNKSKTNHYTFYFDKNNTLFLIKCLFILDNFTESEIDFNLIEEASSIFLCHNKLYNPFIE